MTDARKVDIWKGAKVLLALFESGAVISVAGLKIFLTFGVIVISAYLDIAAVLVSTYYWQFYALIVLFGEDAV